MNKKLFVPLMLAAISLTGCVGQPSPATPGDQPAPKATEAVTFADAPEGCPKSTKVTAKTSGLAETTFTSVSNWYTVWKNTPDAAQLVFSTYDVAKDNIYASHEYSDKDALVVVRLKDTVTNKVGVGNYSKADDAKMKVIEANVSSKGLAGGVFDKNGSVEITYLDSKYACGTMKFDDGRGLLNGDFIAQVNLMGL